MVASGVRFILAGLLTLGVLAAFRRLGPRPSWIELRGAAIAGSWILIGGVGLVAVTTTHVASNLTAVLASTTSLWVVGYRALGRERIGRSAVAGAIVGVAGVIVLLSPGGGRATDPWLLLAVLAALFWSTGSYYGRRIEQPADPFVGAVVQMLCAGCIMLVAGFVLDGAGASIRPRRPGAPGWR